MDADDPLAGELLPPALGLAVVHHEVGVAELAGGAEIQHRVAHPPVVDHGRVAEWAEGDRDRHTPHRVVDDLVPDQDLQWIGAVLAAEEHADHGLGIGEIVDLGSGREDRIVDRGNAVLGRPAGHDLVERDRRLRKIRRPPLRHPVRRRLARHRGVERKRYDERESGNSQR